MSECCSRCIIRNPLEGNLSEETVPVPAWQQLGNPGRRHGPAQPGGISCSPAAPRRVTRRVSPALTATHIQSRRAGMGADGTSWSHTRSTRAAGRARAHGAHGAHAGLWLPLSSALQEGDEAVRGIAAGFPPPRCSPPVVPRSSPLCPVLPVWGPQRAPLGSPPPRPAYQHQQNCSVKS